MDLPLAAAAARGGAGGALCTSHGGEAAPPADSNGETNLAHWHDLTCAALPDLTFNEDHTATHTSIVYNHWHVPQPAARAAYPIEATQASAAAASSLLTVTVRSESP